MKTVICDVDGTIFHPKKKKISEKDLNALKSLRKKGIGLVFNTSRSLEEISWLQYDLTELCDILITSSGALLTDFSQKAVKEIENVAAIIADLEVNNLSYRYVTSSGKSYLNIDDPYWQDLYQEIYGHKLHVKAYENEEVIHLHYHPKDNDLNYEVGKECYNNVNLIFTSRTHECVNKETDKGKALAFLDYEESYGIGDGNSDYALLKACNYKIAMANGKDKLKEIADYVTSSIDDDGFYQAMKYYQLI